MSEEVQTDPEHYPRDILKKHDWSMTQVHRILLERALSQTQANLGIGMKVVIC